MYNILKLNSISNKIANIFNADYNVSDECKNPDAILVRSYNMADYIIGDKLRAVGRAGAGVNNIPLDRMTNAGVVVFNTPGANANAVKELVICSLFLASRDIISGIEWANSLSSDNSDVSKTVEKGKAKFAGSEIAGKTLGVIGLGAIGAKVALSAKALGMRILGSDPYISDANRNAITKCGELVSLDELVSKSDYITLHIPYTGSNKWMLNSSLFNKMKNGVKIINMSRAELVNTIDLKAAINDGIIGCYVVDFPTSDILNTKGIIAIPHLGASTEEAEDNCAVMVAKQIKDFLESGNIINSVNFPSIVVDKQTKNRLIVICMPKNNIRSGIESILKDLKFSISYVENTNIGYALVDTEIDICKVSSSNINLFAEISKLLGVVSLYSINS
ncbi:MAG: 3-phosphoglycerate dehydrogenase [Christensenellaceae bacterium]|jgi:D-3-phosphoglycerate dehydrogenase|nr:3-phosphoglycerate dehydrogenase [Christensenellaceae bacterium]